MWKDLRKTAESTGQCAIYMTDGIRNITPQLSLSFGKRYILMAPLLMDAGLMTPSRARQIYKYLYLLPSTTISLAPKIQVELLKDYIA